ncbi:MAG TPA: hypothetical protein VE820_09210 [Sphingomicrobium sp.]|nr:hypothetical protein [Sphingomicrobium sp.]
MRTNLILATLCICATPATAQTVGPAAAPPPAIGIAPETVDRLADSMQSISQALLDMKVGGVEAALEGRKASRAERDLTVRDLGRRNDPNFDRNIEQQIASARPKLAQGARALNEALPQITHDLQNAQASIERAISNLPDPNYPRR